ncbi:MAG TPA: hypothetical protein VK737_06085 [Opitutales bacterium]|nr:hypothetical protein [Opitutales bacterium]
MTKEEFSKGIDSAISGCDEAIMDNRGFEWLLRFIGRTAKESGDSVMMVSVSSAEGKILLAMKSKSEKNRRGYLSEIKDYCANIGRDIDRIEKSKSR